MQKPRRRLGDYTLVKHLGGSMSAEVSLARHTEAGHHVAIKRLLPHAQESPEARARFADESALALSLKHPGIVRGLAHFYGPLGEQDLCLVMAHLEGAPMSDLLVRELKACPTEGALAHAGIALAQALIGLHDAPQGALVHGDISAGNILVDEGGAVTLIDLGSAGHVGAPTRDDGTPRYRAPERALGGPLTTTGDIYALGVLLWELAAGRRWPVEAPRQLPASSPLSEGPLDALIARCVASDPAARPRDARALAEALEPLCTAEGERDWRLWLTRSTDPLEDAPEDAEREGRRAWAGLGIALSLTLWVGLWFIAQMR